MAWVEPGSFDLQPSALTTRLLWWVMGKEVASLFCLQLHVSPVTALSMQEVALNSWNRKKGRKEKLDTVSPQKHGRCCNARNILLQYTNEKEVGKPVTGHYVSRVTKKQKQTSCSCQDRVNPHKTIFQ